MLELYLSKIIIYCAIALILGFAIGWGTLMQDIKKGETFNFLHMFKKLKSLFEWLFNSLAKLLKMITTIDIDPV